MQLNDDFEPCPFEPGAFGREVLRLAVSQKSSMVRLRMYVEIYDETHVSTAIRNVRK